MPFRDPVEQARSLLRQHQRFLAIHREEPFSRQYMDDSGHLEFGDLHRPIDFPDLNDALRPHRADTLDYWVAYWVAAFRHITGHAADVVLVSYENICNRGEEALAVLAARLGFMASEFPDVVRHSLRAPRLSVESTAIKDSDLLGRARMLHQEPLGGSII